MGLFVAFIFLSFAPATGFSEALRNTFVSDFSSRHYFQSCLNNTRNCYCDNLCHFYRDCCKDYTNHQHNVTLKKLQVSKYEYLECRLPVYSKANLSQPSECLDGGYMMISRCPNNASKTLRTKCEGNNELDALVEVSYLTPENDRNGIIFKNSYCAQCHNILTEEILPWPTFQSCNVCPDWFPLIQNRYVNHRSLNCCISFKPDLIRFAYVTDDALKSFRRCDVNMIRSCPVGTNLEENRKCSEFSSPGYFRGFYFKNVFCAICHGMDNLVNWSEEVQVISPCPGTMLSDVDIGISFRDSLCKLIGCSPGMDLCGSGKLSNHFVSLIVNDIQECEHLQERAERCFSRIFQLTNSMSSWEKMVGKNPLWDQNHGKDYTVIVYQLPKNTTVDWRIQLDEDLFLAANSIGQTKHSCYLKYIEVVEVCSDQIRQRLGECNGELLEVGGDTLLHDNDFLSNFTSNFSKDIHLTWYSVHTRFPLEFRFLPKKRTLMCFSQTQNHEGSALYQTFCNICIGVAIALYLATFFTYAAFKPLRNTFGISLMCFVISIAMSLSFLHFIADYVINISHLCKVVAVLSHFFWVSSFSWVTILVWDLFVTLVSSRLRVRKASSRKRLVTYCCIGWGMPLTVVLICIVLWVLDVPGLPVKYGSIGGEKCFISDDLIKIVAVGGPLVTCLFSNIILFVMIGKILFKHKKSSKVLKTKQGDLNYTRRTAELLVYIKISTLMGCSWIFGFLADFTRIFTLWWFFYLSFLLQASLIFAFFGLSAQVRKMWKNSSLIGFTWKSTRIK